MDGSSWFLACRLLSTYPHCVLGKFRYLQNNRQIPLDGPYRVWSGRARLVEFSYNGTFLWNFLPNSGLFASADRSSNRVINLAQERWTLWSWCPADTSWNIGNNRPDLCTLHGWGVAFGGSGRSSLMPMFSCEPEVSLDRGICLKLHNTVHLSEIFATTD